MLRAFERLEHRLLLAQTPLRLFELVYDVTDSRGEDSLSSIYRLGDQFAAVAAPHDSTFAATTHSSSSWDWHSDQFPPNFEGMPDDIVQRNDELYLFVDNDKSNSGIGFPPVEPAGQRIWKFSMDGGLEQVVQISSHATKGNAYSGQGRPFQFAFGQQLYFAADADVRLENWRHVPGNFGLWRTDGTAEGTVPVLDLIPGFKRAYSSVEINERLLLSLKVGDGLGRWELWTFDGTTSGTQKISPGFASSFVISNGRVYFIFDSEFGKEVFVSDGSFEGTRLVKDLNAGPSGSDPSNLTVFQDGLVFTADAGEGEQLWYTDGSADGTNVLFPSAVHEFIVADQLYFTSGNDATELYRATGDAVERIFDSSSSITFLGATEDMLLFETDDTMYSVGVRNGITQPLRFEAPGEFRMAISGAFVFTTDELEINEFWIDGWFEVESIYRLQPWISDGTQASIRTLGEPSVVHEGFREGVPGPTGKNHRLIRVQEVDNYLTFRIQMWLDDMDKVVDFAYGLENAFAPTPGDANQDGSVDFADFLILSANFGRTDAAFADGDFDGSGHIDFADFLILSNNFGQ